MNGGALRTGMGDAEAVGAGTAVERAPHAPTEGVIPLPERLRTATRAAHERLERITGLPGSIRTPADLRSTLEGLFGFHLAAEAAGASDVLAGFGDELARPPSPSAWLADDLATLGATPEEIAALPSCTALGPLRTVAARLGCAYVVEGSTLGGRVIHAHLSRPEGLAGAFRTPPLRFFAGHGAGTARRWKAFARALDARERPPSDDAETIAAAQETFRVLGDWFEARARAERPRRRCA